jgi:hypothetical protein
MRISHLARAHSVLSAVRSGILNLLRNPRNFGRVGKLYRQLMGVVAASDSISLGVIRGPDRGGYLESGGLLPL